jgi:hypothetical protein
MLVLVLLLLLVWAAHLSINPECDGEQLKVTSTCV